MKNYLSQYGSKQKIVRSYQMGGPAPAPAPAPAQGGGGEDEIIQLASAAIEGDMEAAAQLGMMVAPMILEQSGGAPAGGQPPMDQGMPPEDPGMEADPGMPAARQGAVLYRAGGKFGAPVFKSR